MISDSRRRGSRPAPRAPTDMVRLDAVITAAERKHGIPVGEIKMAAVLEPSVFSLICLPIKPRFLF